MTYTNEENPEPQYENTPENRELIRGRAEQIAGGEDPTYDPEANIFRLIPGGRYLHHRLLSGYVTVYNVDRAAEYLRGKGKPTRAQACQTLALCLREVMGADHNPEYISAQQGVVQAGVELICPGFRKHFKEW